MSDQLFVPYRDAIAAVDAHHGTSVDAWPESDKRTLLLAISREYGQPVEHVKTVAIAVAHQVLTERKRLEMLAENEAAERSKAATAEALRDASAAPAAV